MAWPGRRGAVGAVGQHGGLEANDGRSDTRFSRAHVAVGQASRHQLTPAVEARQPLELKSGVSGDRARIARLTAGLQVAMTRTLALTVGLAGTYNTQPPAGFGSNGFGLFTGLKLKFDGQ